MHESVRAVVGASTKELAGAERESAHMRAKVRPCTRGGLGCKTWPMGLAMKKAAKTLPLTDGCAESSMKHGAIHWKLASPIPDTTRATINAPVCVVFVCEVVGMCTGTGMEGGAGKRVATSEQHPCPDTTRTWALE